ncbi:ParB/RepB/Spo0J family partition protein [Roseobacter sp. HKCCD9010]|uniref:ParB/RepB/Spo0J family partition protein n=2 Tax=unclassified Roseobacter TaxID=196798 RepID=UPI0014921892|nr:MULTISPECIES: ParB/RepB/Spo0J family partition protein [unclassified Roseobacter]MBF9048437.1 ParB/RepB/Spo0J family partition protein [Rhodobacterales bacterium HKCCD4356]NNV10436.1 ParB/RepB/Spo0J family partition protein [Roseobacter sp. HKCCD7357]NNV14621.1 ParB/RepB/Spo0J family partition protein [Roseobacter sp. HKCCD8768]NNV24080.1 ParB/RepB/Spo0J family partition protein [Roseobacter sp. HKCCD8192]NNV28337.1 ParB/RepB/Spo0J family partition protein [Roseobacter sp. HKCCD9061]
MSSKKEKRGLGRGLSALMADIEPATERAAEARAEEAPRRSELQIPIEHIQPNPDQPRRVFTEEALEELAASIREKGVIQPLILRPDPNASEKYQIVAGERRWRAAQRAQLHEVPAIVRDFDDTEVLEVAIIENIQRSDLNAMEEAAGYRQLMDRFGHTQEKLAEAMGKSRSHVANLMRLLTLPEEVQGFVRDGQLSAGHARAMITAEDPLSLARKVISKALSVRDVERLAKSQAFGSQPKRGHSPSKDADTKALEGDLSAAIGMKVSIDHEGEAGSGKLSIKYKDLAELDDIVRILNRG